MDLNCDVGEVEADVASGAQEALVALVHRASVACGGHAGDQATMTETVAQCHRHGVLVGAHPSYPDRETFGRQSMPMPRHALVATLRAQIAAIDAVVRAQGGALAHIKPHGALYHDVARNEDLAHALLEATAPWPVPLVAPWGAATLAVLRAERRVLLEAFADRAYRPDGTLVPRDAPGALLHDPDVAAQQVRRFARGNDVDTLCIHGDTPGALAIARTVRAAVLGLGPGDG